ncbi:MAG: hypothetical protein Q4D69_01335 [Buchananella hordeovulneris]|nr:hypothetical protein [Buchananella hordeovulneris]
MLAFVPFVGPVLAAGLLAVSVLASLVAALADVTLAVSGDGSWEQAALSIVFTGLSCLGLGSLRAMGGNVKGLASVPKMWANAGGLKQLGGTRGLARAYGTNAKTAALELRQATIQSLRHPATKLKNAAKALRANHWIVPEKGVEGEPRALFTRRAKLMTERDELIADIKALAPSGLTVSSFSRKELKKTMQNLKT